MHFKGSSPGPRACAGTEPTCRGRLVAPDRHAAFGSPPMRPIGPWRLRAAQCAPDSDSVAEGFWRVRCGASSSAVRSRHPAQLIAPATHWPALPRTLWARIPIAAPGVPAQSLRTAGPSPGASGIQSQGDTVVKGLSAPRWAAPAGRCARRVNTAASWGPAVYSAAVGRRRRWRGDRARGWDGSRPSTVAPGGPRTLRASPWPGRWAYSGPAGHPGRWSAPPALCGRVVRPRPKAGDGLGRPRRRPPTRASRREQLALPGARYRQAPRGGSLPSAPGGTVRPAAMGACLLETVGAAAGGPGPRRTAGCQQTPLLEAPSRKSKFDQLRGEDTPSSQAPQPVSCFF